MTEARALLELADRCQELTAPDREVDWAIRVLLVPKLAGMPLNRKSSVHERAYTGIFEETWKLIPDGWRFGIEQAGIHDHNQLIEAWCWPYESDFRPDWQNGDEGYRSNPKGVRAVGHTEVLALCAAALQARASLETST